ncbi:S8 family peptidase [Microbispora sp. ATCC PTA-5024]|uniref:S8 family peptidase n=1 Tax=Microbispora sp. ATCC PTA-5024 TaxID=316330 RepID=UPI0003DCAB97|nr:S8 family serine peptidase [Microbispora sp. ATCC PTA-5024]ETK36494.1 peptidase S8 and S53 subtilisin kexin sedolisin [Microbispora sp. ATCC PTA-5024]
MNVRGRLTGAAAALALLAGVGGVAATGAGSRSPAGPLHDYLVFYADGARAAATRDVTAAGGVVEGRDDRLGYLIVRAGSPDRLGASSSVVGVTADRAIGRAADDTAAAGVAAPAGGASSAASTAGRARAGDPLSDRQWDMRMIGATPSGSYATAKGSHKVLVGIIDTGVDGRHPDIAPNFNRALSRNFVTDTPKDPNGKKLDGPCEHAGCKDPADEDDDGHGTHVASTIGSPINGIGVSGVAPGVSLVNLRAGTDSGFFFLKPTMDALTYAADVGVDVVNMSFYVDPWTYNCPNNPQDSRAARLEQRAILEGMRRAVNYARARGVTLISAIGNSGHDLGKPTKDTASPDYPPGSERTRTIDNSCIDVPAELPGVISVSSVGPSGRKAGYSDYGTEQTDIAAPGGDVFDGGTALRGERRQILAAAPETALRAQGLIDTSGRPKTSAVVRDCHGGRCAYYQYMEGTSMAAPHVTGVVAIIISRFGKPGKGGLYMDPRRVEKLLYATAVPKVCPSPRLYQYGGADGGQLCEGGTANNGFFGHGVASASKAASLTP